MQERWTLRSIFGVRRHEKVRNMVKERGPDGSLVKTVYGCGMNGYKCVFDTHGR